MIEGPYEGLCIGGPADGEHRVFHHRVMVVLERSDSSIHRLDVFKELLSAAQRVTQAEYVHQYLRVGDKDFGFWVAVDYFYRHREVSPRHVMERLIENYRPVRNHYGQPVVYVDGKIAILHQMG